LPATEAWIEILVVKKALLNSYVSLLRSGFIFETVEKASLVVKKQTLGRVFILILDRIMSTCRQRL
jgi:hypothetical protein